MQESRATQISLPTRLCEKPPDRPSPPVEAAFGIDIEYAVLQKIYASTPIQRNGTVRPSASVAACRRSPDRRIRSTSPPATWSGRTSQCGCLRRFTRLTNASRKKIEMHAHAVMLHFMYYNFGEVHQTLRVTPAMVAGVADRVWSLQEIAL